MNRQTHFVVFHPTLRALSSAVVALAVLANLATTLFAAETKKPTNFVVFLVDDLGYMDVGANNPNCFYDTPNIDRLAKQGMRFTNGYAACQVCSPTRFSIMTGKYPTRAGCTDYFSGRRAETFKPADLNDAMPLEEITVAEALKERGYATFFAGKWHLGPGEAYWPEHQGFDVNMGGIDRGGPYGGKKYFSPYGNPRLSDGPEGEHLPDRLAAEAVKFMTAHRDQPFLTYVSFYSVHTPLIGRPDLVEKYKKKAEAIQGKEFDDEEQTHVKGGQRQVRILQKHAVYAAMVEAMDQAVGRVLKGLDDLGLAENTVVLFTSDNGGLSTSEGSPTSNLPLRGGKGWMYEGGIREPFIVRWPGVVPSGSECAVPVMSMDLLPTCLEIVGAPAAKHTIDGQSFLPLLKQETAGTKALQDRPLFWHYPHYGNQGGFPSGAIRRGDWKLIQRYEDGRVHLYNLKDDIGERNDLAAQHPDRVQEMQQELFGWYRSVGAKFLQPKTPDGPAPWQPPVD
ncbi:MAG: sulfatase [Planctomycetaceae bacterium]